MELLFLYGPVASGKLTIAREVAARTGWALFHNHLIVDAVAAVFPFGSPEFVRLRERFWLETIGEAVAADRSLIFTFAPEPSVAPDFPERVRGLVENGGGHVRFVALELGRQEQERRIDTADRAAFGKLRSLEVLRELRPGFDRCMAAMPTPALTLQTDRLSAEEAASAIVRLLA